MTIRTFESMDEMLREVGADRKAADENTQAWQRAVDVGDCFIWRAHGILIHCETMEDTPLEDEEDEVRTRGPNHYRLVRAYSEYCPYGELGYVHVSTIEKIVNRADFDSRVAQLKVS